MSFQECYHCIFGVRWRGYSMQSFGMIRSIVEHVDDLITAMCVTPFLVKSGEPRFIGFEAHVPVIIDILIALTLYQELFSCLDQAFGS